MYLIGLAIEPSFSRRRRAFAAQSVFRLLEITLDDIIRGADGFVAVRSKPVSK